MKIKTKIIIILLLVLSVALGLFLYFISIDKGTVSFVIEPTNATVTVNNKPVDTSRSLSLPVGEHTFRATLQGYFEEQQTVTVQKNKTTQVTLFLVKKTTEAAIARIIETSDLYKDQEPKPKFVVTKLREFYDNSWALATIKEQGSNEPAITILRKNMSSNEYEIFLAPATSPSQDFIDSLPIDIRNSLQNEEWFEVSDGDHNHEGIE